MKEWQRVWDSVEKLAGTRRLPERVIAPLFNAAFGGRLRNSTYRTETEVSLDVAGRDLKLLTEQRLLVPFGERRGRYYVAYDQLKIIREKARTGRPPLDNPFGTPELRGQKVLF